MERSNFTLEQLKAIESEEKTLLVSASAGSGKTRVLITRIIQLIKSKKVSLKNMLVCTFTKLASGEMKNRLKQELEKDAPTDLFFQSELSELSVANISTLHKFCQNLIKEFFYAVQIDPNFNVLEDEHASFLKNKALNNVVESYLKSLDDDFKQIYDIFFENRSDESFKQSIFQIHSFLMAKDSNYINQIDKLYNANVNDNFAIKFIIAEKNQAIAYFIEKLENLLLDSKKINSEKLSSIISFDLQILQTLLKADFTNYYSLHQNSTFARKFLPKNCLSEEFEILEQVKKVMSKAKISLDSLDKCFYFNEKINNDFALSKKLLTKFLEVVYKFNDEYIKLKQKDNSLDFNDLEHYALKILEDKNINNQLSSRFKYVFVDEYQDTNEIQEKIISLLTKDNYIFMVGDVKQSIYMFRECNPQIFINKSEVLSKNQLVFLNKNFRSDKNILNFCNLIFDNIMTQSTAKLDYKKDARLVYGDTLKVDDSDLTHVNILLINKSTKEKEDANLQFPYSVEQDELSKPDSKNIQKEALLIADKINFLKNQKIYDDNIKAYRNITFSDIAILTRSREAIKNISNVLISCNIPINAEYKIELYKCFEIRLLISLLKLINNFKDDINLASVMKSICFNFSDDDLAHIRLNSQDEFFYQAVLNYNKQDEIKDKIDNIFKFINYFKKLLLSNSISTILVKMISYFNLEEKFSSEDNYIEILENINYFILNVKNLEDYNLTSLIDYFDTFAGKKEETISIQKNLNSVYVGTIHSSKGLEYPVVFLADSAKDFSTQSQKEKIIKNSELGLAMSSYNVVERVQKDNVIKNILKYKVSLEEKQEEMRLLYVALTRAKNYLYIVGTENLAKVENLFDAYQIKQAKNYLQLILGSLPSNIIKEINKLNLDINYNSKQLNFSVEIHTADYFNTHLNQKQLNYEVDEEFNFKLEDYFNVKFDNSPFVFKNTVTALVEEDNENYNIKDFHQSKPDYKQSDEDFLKIGTNYHKVLEKIDFSIKNMDELDLSINNLLDNNILFNSDLEFVDKTKILSACKNLSKIISPNDVILKEKQFMYYPTLNSVVNTTNQNRVLVQGMVDLIILKPNEIFVVDYKTSRLTSEQKFKDKYAMQLNLYASAIEKFYNKKVTKKFIYSFYLDKLIIV